MPEQQTTMMQAARDALFTARSISQFRYGVLFEFSYVVLYSRMTNSVRDGLADIRATVGDALCAELADEHHIVFILSYRCRLGDAIALIATLHRTLLG